MAPEMMCCHMGVFLLKKKRAARSERPKGMRGCVGRLTTSLALESQMSHTLCAECGLPTITDFGTFHRLSGGGPICVTCRERPPIKSAASPPHPAFSDYISGREKSFTVSGYAFPTDAEWQAIIERITTGNATEADRTIYHALRWRDDN
jgi:hypothetical protein